MKEYPCPVCGAYQTDPLFNVPDLPVFDNVLCGSRAAAKTATRGMQSLTLCCRCGFVYNRTFEPKKVVYGENYHAERGHSAYFNRHMQGVLEWIQEEVSLTGKTVLEAACGDGDFLRAAAAYGTRSLIGVDPSAGETGDGTTVIHRMLFDERYLAEHPDRVDVLINRHMIEHIQNPLNMLKLFSGALTVGGILYLETPRLDWILQNRVFFDFPYEHCSYFSDGFLERLLHAAGFSVHSVQNTYSGQYYSVLARKEGGKTRLDGAAPAELDRLRSGMEATRALYENSTERLSRELNAIRRSFDGTICDVYLWGGSAKGVLCCNLLRVPIKACIDSNPYKQGKFIPGTGTQVVSPGQLAGKEAALVLVVNDVYLDEITAEAARIAPKARIQSISHLLGIGNNCDSGEK